MALFDNFPWTNVHELNLDWMIKNVKKVSENIETTAENAQIATDKANEAKTYAERAQEAVETLAGVKRRYIVLGDSYGRGWTPESTTDGWPIRIKNILGVSDEDFYTNSVGGVGFCNTVNNQNWLTMLSGINASNPETITDIIVAGGYNDKGYTITQIVSAITSFLGIAKNLYPNATVRVGMIAYSFETTGNIVKQLANTLVAYQRTPFINSNGVYMNNVENTLVNSLYMSPSDKHHPNDTGLGFIAMNIINCIKTGSCDILNAQFSDLTPADGVTLGSNAFSMFSEATNSDLSVYLTSGIINGDFNYTGSDLDILIGTYQGYTCVNGDISRPLYQTVSAVIRKNVGKLYREVPIVLYITKNELHAWLRLINDDGNNYYSGKIIQIQVGTYTAMHSQTFLSI